MASSRSERARVFVGMYNSKSGALRAMRQRLKFAVASARIILSDDPKRKSADTIIPDWGECTLSEKSRVLHALNGPFKVRKTPRRSDG